MQTPMLFALTVGALRLTVASRPVPTGADHVGPPLGR
jgi:hypothetical protein